MSYQLELRHLHYFLTLAQELHFRRAADRLFITQPGLSRQIKQLEQHFGLELFIRNKRRVILSSAGERLLEEAQKVFSQISLMQQRMEELAQGPKWTLKLGFIGSAMQSCIPELLMQLGKEEEKMELLLNELSTTRQIESLLNFSLDVGFVRLSELPTELNQVTLFEETFSLVLRENDPRASGTNPVNLGDFKDEHFILFSKEYSSAYYQLVMSIFQDHHFIPHVALRTVNAMSIFTLVSQGKGVAIVPSSLQKGYNLPVKFLELSHIRQRTSLQIIWNPANINPALQHFLQTQKPLNLNR